MNKDQQSAFNNFLKAAAALLLTFVEEAKAEAEKKSDKKTEKKSDKKTEPAPETPATEEPDDLLGDSEAAETEKPADDSADDLLGPSPEEAKKAEADKKKAEADAKKKAEAEKKEITKTNPDELLANCRAAAVKYAGKHGREALRTLLNKYTKGTIAEVPKDKLGALLTELSESK